MTKIKSVKNKVKKDIEKYVNIDTGETLQSELICGKETIIAKKDTDLFTIESKEFIVIESKAMIYLSKILTASEFEKVLCMANMVKTEFNILFNYNIPHTPDTLSKELQLTVDNLTRLIKKLHKKGILAYIVSYKSGYLQKIYMLNPTVARKRKTFHNDLLEIFEDLSK